jgi:hypothetical protein
MKPNISNLLVCSLGFALAQPNLRIWIQYDGTEVGVANELVESGIPKEDIVLAYHSQFIRQYDGFAVCSLGFAMLNPTYDLKNQPGRSIPTYGSNLYVVLLPSKEKRSSILQ